MSFITKFPDQPARCLFHAFGYTKKSEQPDRNRLNEFSRFANLPFPEIQAAGNKNINDTLKQKDVVLFYATDTNETLGFVLETPESERVAASATTLYRKLFSEAPPEKSSILGNHAPRELQKETREAVWNIQDFLRYASVAKELYQISPKCFMELVYNLANEWDAKANNTEKPSYRFLTEAREKVRQIHALEALGITKEEIGPILQDPEYNPALRTFAKQYAMLQDGSKFYKPQMRSLKEISKVVLQSLNEAIEQLSSSGRQDLAPQVIPQLYRELMKAVPGINSPHEGETLAGTRLAAARAIVQKTLA